MTSIDISNLIQYNGSQYLVIHTFRILRLIPPVVVHTWLLPMHKSYMPGNSGDLYLYDWLSTTSRTPKFVLIHQTYYELRYERREKCILNPLPLGAAFLKVGGCGAGPEPTYYSAPGPQIISYTPYRHNIQYIESIQDWTQYKYNIL